LSYPVRLKRSDEDRFAGPRWWILGFPKFFY
jgi:hypothetical protein